MRHSRAPTISRVYFGFLREVVVSNGITALSIFLFR